MEQELRIRLLGGCQINLDDEPEDGLLAKQEALLAYLAVSRQEHARTAVAALLWGGKSDSDALRNLRVNLATLSPRLKKFLDVGRQTVGLDVNGRYWLDVEAFETCLARSRQPNGRLNHALLREAIQLYRGDFMAEFDPGDAEEFEEWLAAQRLRLQAQYIQALDALIEHAIDQEVYDEGIDYAQKLLAIEPWREETHQQLMWLLALDGQFSAALAQYEACCDMLAEVFGKQPTAETARLYDDIVQMRDQQGRGSTRPLPPLPEPTAPQIPFQAPRPPDNFLGREMEIDQLWQRMSGKGNGRFPTHRFLISGMGGVGKSSLAQQLAQTLRGEFPDGVLWANAASGDPMQIAEQWAAAYGYDFSGVADLDNRAAALRQLLAEKKALLIFDDLVEAARIRPLLPTAGECITLITTRNAHLAAALDAQPVPLRELTPHNGLKLLTRLIGQERVEAESGKQRPFVTTCKTSPSPSLSLAVIWRCAPAASWPTLPSGCVTRSSGCKRYSWKIWRCGCRFSSVGRRWTTRKRRCFAGWGCLTAVPSPPPPSPPSPSYSPTPPRIASTPSSCSRCCTKKETTATASTPSSPTSPANSLATTPTLRRGW